ncbi:MAG: hypothetical protein HRU35_04090 [Rickettsiaceae bacterium]|nr:hypothetical protein [Rickettsiaceae bacterium]
MNIKPKNKTTETMDLIRQFEYLRDLPGYFFVKNSNSYYQSVSEDFAHALGWNSISQAIGKSDYNIPSGASELAKEFINIDQKIINSNKPGIIIQMFHSACGFKSFLSQKKPIHDNTGKAIGIICNGTDITKLVLKEYGYLNQLDRKFITNLKPKQYILTPEFSPLPISQRQQECLSWFIRGKTAKEIALILGISYRTVEIHIQTIKHRLGCQNKSQLIEKAIDSGFLFHVPEIMLGLNIPKMNRK